MNKIKSAWKIGLMTYTRPYWPEAKENISNTDPVLI